MSGGTRTTSGDCSVMSGGGISGWHPRPPAHERRIARAWEEFAAGKDAIQGVRPQILASWYRCRDQYGVDPGRTLAPSATDGAEHPFEYDVVIAELGGLAVSAANEIPLEEGVVTVTDGQGSILAYWGDRLMRHHAADSNLAPLAAWSERASGTNGMGTALETPGPVSVIGAEHWCAGFHQWACAGIAIRDLVTGNPIATINASRWLRPLPRQTSAWLAESARRLEVEIRERATADGAALAAVFTTTKSKTPRPLFAMDHGGKVVAANNAAGVLLAIPHDRTMIDPADRWLPDLPGLPSIARWAAGRARHDPEWVGSARLVLSPTDTVVGMSMRPVFAGNRFIGVLCECGSQDGEPYEATGHTTPPTAQHVIGVRDGRLILLRPAEIRFAEADRNTVWLNTDRGRIQADVRGLDNLDKTLSGQGFHRVHRRFLVNLRRVKEVERGFKGDLMLITEPRASEVVPVSRRHAPELRRILGV